MCVQNTNGNIILTTITTTTTVTKIMLTNYNNNSCQSQATMTVNAFYNITRQQFLTCSAVF